MGLDLGERRIGVAMSDSSGILVTPYGVLDRSGDPETDRRALAELVVELGAGIVVVGLPLSLSGGAGPAARGAVAEASALEAILNVPVETFDERLTTVEAQRRRRDRVGGEAGTVSAVGARRDRAAGATGRRRGGRALRPRGGALRRGIDAEAAAVMLEAWLSTPRPQSPPEGPSSHG